MTSSDIKKLLEGVTPGKWEALGRNVRGCYDKQMDDYRLSLTVDPDANDRKDAAFIAAAPEIAQTCLDALARVEELEKEWAACLAYCKEQNGLDYCKNCGLGYTEEEAPEVPTDWTNPRVEKMN